MKKVLIMCMGCLLAIGLTGCGDSPGDKAVDFFEALRDGDVKAYQKLSSDDTQLLLGGAAQMKCPKFETEKQMSECLKKVYSPFFQKIELVSEKEKDENTVDIVLSVTNSKGEISQENALMKKINGEWKADYAK